MEYPKNPTKKMPKMLLLVERQNGRNLERKNTKKGGKKMEKKLKMVEEMEKEWERYVKQFPFDEKCRSIFEIGFCLGWISKHEINYKFEIQTRKVD